MWNHRLHRPREAEPILIEGLRRLEYRGYDSSGLATLTGAHLHLRKKAGRIQSLARHLRDKPAPGTSGISHTRWATHGPANDRNAHPHVGGDGQVAVVHNGVIENYAVLKRQLIADGVIFHSDTDTEVIAHLIAVHLNESAAGGDWSDNDLVDAVSKTLALLKGTYGLAIVSPRCPGVVVGARLGSPLVLGIGEDENFLASDPGALVGQTEKVVYLQDHQMCVLTAGQAGTFSIRNASACDAPIQQIAWEPHRCRQGQRSSITCSRRFTSSPKRWKTPCAAGSSDADATAHFGGLNLDTATTSRAPIASILTACGTSYHAALVGEYLFEEFARIPVEVEYASEFRYRNPPIDRNTIVLALTQSGETADTLAALRRIETQRTSDIGALQCRRQQHRREADGGVYLHAGPEIGVASTKAFTNQVAVLAMLALYFGRMRHLSSLQGAAHGARIARHSRRGAPDPGM